MNITDLFSGDSGKIRQLVAAAGPNTVDSKVGNSPLYNATYMDKVDAVVALLELGANPNLRLSYRSPVDGRLESNVVALMYARSGDAAQALIAGGADVNASDDLGRTPLSCAVSRGNEEVIRILLNAGADRNAKTNLGQTLVDLVDNLINKYKSWDVGPNSAAIAEKTKKLAQIRDLLARNVI